MAYSTADLDVIVGKLEAGLALGAATVSFEGRSVSYRSVADIRSAISYFAALYDNATDASTPKPKVRTLLFYGGNGIGF